MLKKKSDIKELLRNTSTRMLLDALDDSRFKTSEGVVVLAALFVVDDVLSRLDKIAHNVKMLELSSPPSQPSSPMEGVTVDELTIEE